MYGTDRGRSGLQRDDENEAHAEELTLFQPVPTRKAVDRYAVDARDLVEGVPLVYLVARGPLSCVPRRARLRGADTVRQDQVRAHLQLRIRLQSVRAREFLHANAVPLREARQGVPLPHGDGISGFSTMPSPDARPSAPFL